MRRSLGIRTIVTILFALLLWIGCAAQKAEVVQDVELEQEDAKVPPPEPGQLMYAISPTKIREERSKESRVIGKLNGGQKVKAAFLQDEWYAVFDPDATDLSEEYALGYVHMSRLRPVPDVSQEVKLAYAVTRCNIRARPTKASKVVGMLEAGERVKAGFLTNGWYAVFDPDEVDPKEEQAIGYVFAPLLREVPGQVTSP